jgi:hypothetical protein
LEFVQQEGLKAKVAPFIVQFASSGRQVPLLAFLFLPVVTLSKEAGIIFYGSS